MRKWTAWAAVAIAIAGGAFVWSLAASGPARAAATAADTQVTFTRDIAPIVFQNCTSCHRAGQVAPFTLSDYHDVRRHAKEIAELTADRTMPPWKPADGFGDFAGQRRLTDRQIDLIQQWVKEGRPEGNAADLPPAPAFASGWTLGEPDLIVRMPEPFTVPAGGPDIYRVFVIPVKLSADQYVTALEFRPSNPKVVHHSLFYLDKSGVARELEAQSPTKPGYARTGSPGFVPSGGLGGWAPGAVPHFLPDGAGRPMPAGADLILHTHFHPSGKIEKEQSVVGLYFAKKPPDKVLLSIPHGSNKIDIAPGDSNYVIDNSFTVPADVELAGIIPHAHLLCRQMKVTATTPDGSELPLIWIKDWDWNWQEQYYYRRPVHIPGGTRVRMVFTYDNSANNPHNPNSPPKRVVHGEQTGDEMALVFYQLLIDRSQLENLRALRQMLGRRHRAAETRTSE